MPILTPANRFRRYLPVAFVCLLSTPGFACIQQAPANQYAKQQILAQFQRLKSAQRAVKRADDGTPQPPASMVGMWMTTFTTGGEVFDVGFDVWHSDGTQILNDAPPPASGAVCLGIWTQTGDYTYSLKHPTWLFDETNTNLIGVGYILEAVTLDPGGYSFSGTYSVVGYDLDGNQTFEVDGEISGDRITIDPPATASAALRKGPR
jgi:hypothetical protein